ncbi:MAG: hypothetical protein HQL26_02300 [Candidatus Omnitrophica bacterium]|nr:hypothetical protein [Candidatus Omnitrophota bacterium]
MKRVCLLILLCVGLYGCVTVEKEDRPPANTAEHKQLIPVNLIRPGMSSAEVKSVLGNNMVIGYQKKDKTGIYEPINMAIPLKSEDFKRAQEKYRADFYYVEVRLPDGIISDEEITPVVFKNDLVVGIGWDFYKSLKIGDSALFLKDKKNDEK